MFLNISSVMTWMPRTILYHPKESIFIAINGFFNPD